MANDIDNYQKVITDIKGIISSGREVHTMQQIKRWCLPIGM